MSDETTEYISLPVNSVQYVNDKLLRVSAENAALRAEIDRLRVRCRQIDDEAYDYAEQIEALKAAAKDSMDHYTDARAEVDRLRDQLYLADPSARSSSADAARLGRILAALREPSADTVEAATCTFNAWDEEREWIKHGMVNALRAAVTAAEQEVGRE